jgi:predicted CoA-binding protein
MTCRARLPASLRFEIPARFPQTSDVSQPEMTGFDVQRHLTDVMLHVRIVNLFLRRDVVESRNRMQLRRRRGR